MITKYDVILFDLDGTLTDPQVGITKSIQHSLKYFGIIEEDLNPLIKFIGPPLKESFMEYYGFDSDKAVLAIEKYREYFAVTGLFENEVYPAIPELLADLFDNGKKLIVATSKPTEFSQRILDHFGLSKYLSFIAGSNLDGSRTRKGEVISYALKQCGLESNARVVMVGDRKHDIMGARENGIDSIGVLYGYGSRHELEKEHPTFIAEDVHDLRKFLL
jgi:phosphoglycolate phosphatase